MKLLLSLVLLFQSVKMTEDFLPLQVGNRWVYDVKTEAGEKTGTMEFAVNDRTIVSGRSLYVVSGFPFAGESSEPVRFIAYDREGRQFVRVTGDQAAPLFPGDAESTEVLQSDSSGVPQKFALRTGSATLVFQRGVGIIEARLKTADGVHIATLTSSSVGKGNAAPPAVAAAPPKASPPAAPPVPDAVPGRTPVPNVAAVTAENPVLIVSSEATAEGLKLELLVVNTADKLLPFRFNSSNSYDFVITDAASDQEVWRWSHGMTFDTVNRTDSIRASGKWTFSEVWNRRDNNRNPVPPGRYRLVGIVTSLPAIQSNPVSIEVR
jgi:hypothetical protein